jgi:hypothetical protein
MYEQRYEGRRQLVWSQKSATVGEYLFHPFTGPIPTSDLTEIRPTVLDIKAGTGLCEVAIGYQLTNEANEESDWGTTATMLSADFVPTDGETYEDDFTDVTTSMTKRFIRFGYMVINTSGSTVQAAQVAASVDCR